MPLNKQTHFKSHVEFSMINDKHTNPIDRKLKESV